MMSHCDEQRDPSTELSTGCAISGRSCDCVCDAIAAPFDSALHPFVLSAGAAGVEG